MFVELAAVYAGQGSAAVQRRFRSITRLDQVARADNIVTFRAFLSHPMML